MAFSFTNLLSLFLILSAVLGANAAGQCVVESEATKMAPCVEAAQNANAPVSAGCCNAVHKFSTDPACLCSVLLSKTAKDAGIDPAVAVSIPKRCQFSDRPVGYKCGAYTVP
uniref:Bifunctional inhibitor/plant lipid transfer protein/seed storage helical domain-containing protein n=1 Tax=Picea sitchensis TaxID=3332 RepID=B8LN95_PICSI|nr:unknown [Picea sitchensis]